MSTILDHVRPVSGATFTPADYNAFFALQLARYLDDVSELTNYLQLFEHYPAVLLAGAARRVTKGLGTGGFDRFRQELQQGRFQGPGSLPPVVGIRVDRRCVGYVVIARGTVLEQDKRELVTNETAALRTAAAFVAERAQQWRNCPVAMLALEAQDIRRAELTRIIRHILAESGLSVWEVSRADILNSYCQPAANTFQQVRCIAGTLLPELSENRSGRTVALDAAIPALYVDAARQLFREDGGGA